MALTMGYNAEQVRKSIEGVKKAYDYLTNAIGVNVENSFVKQMASNWACPEAVQFFTNFKDIMDQLNVAVDNTFESVVNSMKSAATAWAQATSGTWGSVGALMMLPLVKKNKKIDVSSIKNDIGGTRGINAIEATKVFQTALKNLTRDTNDALSMAQNEVRSCGFLGGDQATSLLNSLTTIQRMINQKVTEIINKAKNDMQSSVNKYTDLAKKVSTAFQGKQS